MEGRGLPGWAGRRAAFRKRPARLQSGRRVAWSPQQLFLLGLGMSPVCSFSEKQESSGREEL